MGMLIGGDLRVEKHPLFLGPKTQKYTLTLFFLLVLKLPDHKHQLISVQSFKLEPSCWGQIQNSFVIHS